MEIRWLLIWTIHLNHQQGNKPECGKCYIELLFDKASIWYRRQDTGQTTLCVTLTCQHIYTAWCLEQILWAVEKKFSQLFVVLSEHQEKGKALDFFLSQQTLAWQKQKYSLDMSWAKPGWFTQHKKPSRQSLIVRISLVGLFRACAVAGMVVWFLTTAVSSW